LVASSLADDECAKEQRGEVQAGSVVKRRLFKQELTEKTLATRTPFKICASSLRTSSVILACRMTHTYKQKPILLQWVAVVAAPHTTETTRSANPLVPQDWPLRAGF
jgi:hypothetical protein